MKVQLLYVIHMQSRIMLERLTHISPWGFLHNSQYHYCVLLLVVYWVAPQLLTTSNFIGPWYHTALLFSGLGSIVLLFVVLFSQQIREDLVRAATSPCLLLHWYVRFPHVTSDKFIKASSVLRFFPYLESRRLSYTQLFHSLSFLSENWRTSITLVKKTRDILLLGLPCVCLRWLAKICAQFDRAWVWTKHDGGIKSAKYL